ncbi:MAG: hypothetical protein U1E15_07875 [Hyphomicrobiales bacterium]
MRRDVLQITPAAPAASAAMAEQVPQIPEVSVASPAPPAEIADPDAEHRAKPRMRVLKAAKIVLDDWRAMDCTVRDISETGARIKCGGGAQLPHKFKLLMLADNTIRDVQMAWFLPDQIGVAFIGEPRKAPVRKFG